MDRLVFVKYQFRAMMIRLHHRNYRLAWLRFKWLLRALIKMNLAQILYGRGAAENQENSGAMNTADSNLSGEVNLRPSPSTPTGPERAILEAILERWQSCHAYDRKWVRQIVHGETPEKAKAATALIDEIADNFPAPVGDRQPAAPLSVQEAAWEAFKAVAERAPEGKKRDYERIAKIEQIISRVAVPLSVQAAAREIDEMVTRMLQTGVTPTRSAIEAIISRVAVPRDTRNDALRERARNVLLNYATARNDLIRQEQINRNIGFGNAVTHARNLEELTDEALDRIVASLTPQTSVPQQPETRDPTGSLWREALRPIGAVQQPESEDLGWLRDGLRLLELGTEDRGNHEVVEMQVSDLNDLSRVLMRLIGILGNPPPIQPSGATVEP